MSAGHRARLFFAVEVPDGVRRELAGWARRAARGARVLDAASLHLTLLFLGSRPFEQIDELAAALDRATSGEGASCELSLGAPLWLPPRRPRALAVEVHDESGALAQLHQSLASEVGAAQSGVESDEEPASGRGPAQRFRPHITVARARAGTRVPREFPDPTPQLGFCAERVLLYRSFLEPADARYEPLASAELAGPD